MKSSRSVLSGLIITIIYLLPAMIAGDCHFVHIHDFLDSSVAHIKSMMDNNIVFDNNGTIPILDGIPRSWYLTALDLKVWLFLILPPYWAVVANIFLIKFSAFLGLFLLLDRYVLPEGKFKDKASFITAALFSLAPFYPDYGISSAGVPLVAWCFLNLFSRQEKAVSLMGLAYYALFSWLVLSGVFVCFCTAAVILVHMIRKKKFPVWPFAGLCILTALYLGTNYQMYLNVLTPGEAIQREEFKPLGTEMEAIGQSLATLFVSQYHAGICAAVLMAGSFIALWRKRKSDNPIWNNLMIAFVSLASLMVFTGVFKVLLRDYKFVQVFQFDRFFFLYPALCYTLFGTVVCTLMNENRKKVLVTLSSTVLFTGLVFDLFITNEAGRLLKIGNNPGFKEFYDTELFAKIKDGLQLTGNGDSVACLGMYQAVAEYNGIRTVDGYIQIYPLEYKRRFQKVIQKELDKDPDLKEYFCDWGTRCYLFSSELGKHYMFSKKDDKVVHNLDFDTEALASLGCKYVLSAVKIENPDRLGLELTGTWEGSYWRIRAYRICR